MTTVSKTDIIVILAEGQKHVVYLLTPYTLITFCFTFC